MIIFGRRTHLEVNGFNATFAVAVAVHIDAVYGVCVISERGSESVRRRIREKSDERELCYIKKTVK